MSAEGVHSVYYATLRITDKEEIVLAVSRVTSPEEFFGFRLGDDRKIARWDKIVEYYGKLATESDRIKVEELGKSTEGHPFLLVTISSPKNLAKLDQLRSISARLANPDGLTAAEAAARADEGTAVVVQSMSLHANEIGGTQMAPELTWDLLTRNDSETLRILDNVVFLMVPCFNPDGQIMVTDWYYSSLGTDHEGGTMPWLYHKYTGHDNNRDAFAQNIVESQYMAKLMFRDWYPQTYQDHHHMGSYGARLYVAPYCDPIHPYGDPLIWREHSWYGAHMAYKLEENGKTGILNAAQYAGWAHMGFHWLTIYHNIAGMLTESASANLATPKYIDPGQLAGAHARTMPTYEPQTNFPHPWPGGWWHLREIVEQQKISAWALLDMVARNKETVLYNSYLKATRQTERGAEDTTRTFLIPGDQHDPLTARKLVQILLGQGVRVSVTDEPVTVEGRVYAAGTYSVDAAQPKMGVVKTLLARTLFPDNYWTRRPDGTPQIYDTTTDTVAEFMGVEVVPSGFAPAACFKPIECLPCHEGKVGTGNAMGYIFDGKLNDSYVAVNRLLAAGAKVWRTECCIETQGSCLPAGTFFVEAAGIDTAMLQKTAACTGVDFTAAKEKPGICTKPVTQLRVAMYQRYWGGNMDEGWTRLLLEKFEFPYTTVFDADITAGNLKDRFDVLVLPDDHKQMMIGPHEFKNDPRVKMMLQWIGDMPAKYRSGFGAAGVKAIGEFVAAGGRLVALNLAAELAIEACDLKINNVVAGLDTKAYSTHGATVHLHVDPTHPVAYGMPCEALALNFDSPAFEIKETHRAEKYHPIAIYPKRDVLQGGWLIGEEKIAGKIAALSVDVGKGEAVLLGMRPQFRAQTHGTFKLLFNCLY